MTTITINRAVVEQALEALKDDQYRLVEVSPNQYEYKTGLLVEVGPNQYEYKTDLAIDALERALAQQAEPVEPVAEARYDGTLRWLEPHGVGLHRIQGPLYTAPPQRKPLTEEEIIDATEHIDTSRNGYFIHITRAIERAHGITGDPK